MKRQHAILRKPSDEEISKQQLLDAYIIDAMQEDHGYEDSPHRLMRNSYHDVDLPQVVLMTDESAKTSMCHIAVSINSITHTSVGTAKCGHDDDYDHATGELIAMSRALRDLADGLADHALTRATFLDNELKREHIEFEN